MSGFLPPLVIQRVRHMLHTRGYARSISWDEATMLFGQFVGYYFVGQTTVVFLAALADELLLRLTKCSGEQPNRTLFDILLATSMAPSVSSPQERTHYLKTLGQFYGS